MKQYRLLPLLLGSTCLGGLAIAAPAWAQDATNQPGTQSPGAQQSTTAGPEAGTSASPVPTNNANSGTGDQEIVVTGTLFRRTNTETPSPVSTLSSESLARRGLVTPGDAIRSLSSDNSGSIPLSFTGGFANGASGVSLRGLSVNSTLVLFDGLRGAFYPLADDGQRNFVDLNTIPDVAIDRIEVLRDGASSTYGADAVGGVVNVITKREFSGVQAGAEEGISQRGDAEEHRFSILAGTGSLTNDRWNVYVGGEYYHADPLMNYERGFPFNTGNLSALSCSTGPCTNANPGARAAGATTSAVVRRATQPDPNDPFSLTNTGTGTFQILNPAGCGPMTFARSSATSGNFCEQDIVNQYGEIQPEQERIGATIKGTARLGGDLEAYISGTFFQSKVFSRGNPANIRSVSPVNTTSTVLPVFICSSGVNCATDPNRQLNPNNPFAAEGNAAQIYYRFGDIPFWSETLSRTYRGAAGIHGSVFGDWNFSADITGMHTDLHRTAAGYLNVPGLTQAINTGAYNFVDPTQNSAAVRSLVSPTIRKPATSDLYMGQATITKDLLTLPGGPLQLGLGVSGRYEAIDAPSLNPNNQTITLNAYSTHGHHYVEAGYFELRAPVIRRTEIDLSGRYDHYSEGFSRFSPKIGVKVTPIRQIALRGTYERGFRAPQFAETAGNVVGFTTTNPGTVQAVCTQHGGTFTSGGTCSGGSTYTNPYSIGYFTVANPDLKPEKSQSYTLGAVLQPVSWFSLTADYYHIRKTDVITAGPLSNQAIAAYYAGQPLPAGYTITQSPADPEFPSGIRTVGIVNSLYANAASLVTSGLDVTATAQVRFSPSVRFSSQVEVTDIFKYNFRPCSDAGDPGCATQHYVGTQGPYILSSGSGTPKWRGNWSNSLEAGPVTLTGTAYYTSGYWSTAEDQNGAGTAHDCSNALYDPTFCKTRRYIQVDFVGSYKVSNRFTIYMNVINAFNAKPPFNPANYAAVNYNPTWSYGGIIGRLFRTGVKVSW